MKRLLALVIALAMTLSLAAAAIAEEDAKTGNSLYTYVPGMSSQFDLLGFDAGTESNVDLKALEPTKESDDVLKEIISFTGWNQIPVTEFFPEVIQDEIDAIKGEHQSYIMTDYMRSNLAIAPSENEQETVKMIAEFSLDYLPGQDVLVVFGVQGEDGEVEWIPIDAEVIERGKIAFDLTKENQEKLDGQESLFTVLTRNSEGMKNERKRRRQETEPNPTEEPTVTPEPTEEPTEEPGTTPEPTVEEPTPTVVPSKEVGDLDDVITPSKMLQDVTMVARPSKVRADLTTVEIPGETITTESGDAENGEESAPAAEAETAGGEEGTAADSEENTEAGANRESGEEITSWEEMAGTGEVLPAQEAPVEINVTERTADPIRKEEKNVQDYLEGHESFSDLEENSQQGIVSLMQNDPGLYGKKIYEVVKLEANGFDETLGDVLTNMRFATPYTEDQEIIMMLGCVDESGNEVEWFEERSNVLEPGKIQIVFGESCMKSMQKYKTSILIVFSSEIKDSADDWEIADDWSEE